MTDTNQIDITIPDHKLKPHASMPARVPPRSPSLTDKYPFYGVLGDILRAIKPHVEADEMAIAAPFLAGIANLIGPGPFFIAGHVEHTLSAYVAVVRASPPARKTAALNLVTALLGKIDPFWATHWQGRKLSSGRALIARVRDQSEGDDEDGNSPGIPDKRLFVVDRHLDRTLGFARQPEDSISSALCDLWDDNSAQTLANEPRVEVTDALVSVVGEVNVDETLFKLMLDDGCGLDRRFLWFFVESTKCVPYGRLPTDKLAPLIARLKKIVAFARKVGEMEFSEKAQKIWERLYDRMHERHPERPFPAEALKAHAPKHVLQMACVFALLDMKSTIKTQHLKAAMAMWNYVCGSIDFIFGGRNR